MDGNKLTLDEIMARWSNTKVPPEIREKFGKLKKDLVLSMMEASFSQGMTYAQELNREKRDLSLLHQEWLEHQIDIRIKKLYEGGNTGGNLDKILTL